MATIITEISKYLIIFFMVLYTIKCFTVLKTGAGNTVPILYNTTLGVPDSKPAIMQEPIRISAFLHLDPGLKLPGPYFGIVKGTTSVCTLEEYGKEQKVLVIDIGLIGSAIMFIGSIQITRYRLPEYFNEIPHHHMTAAFHRSNLSALSQCKHKCTFLHF